MENIELIKNIATIASPLTKAVVDLWVSPKLKEIGKKYSQKSKIEDHFFENKFQEYLNEKYKTYSVVNILAFRNQQRQLKDIYLPLTLKENKSGKSRAFKIIGYNDNFIPNYKKVLITDTAGMGKSTLSRRLFLSILEKNKGIPVLIELRRLSQTRKIIDEIYDELKLLDESIDSKFILDLIKRGDFIFFLDGYDEISSSDKKKVTEDLQKFINNASNNNFILTSRPDGSLSSFGQFQEFTINPLKEKEVYQLLKKYDDNGELSKSLISKIKGELYREMGEFLTNPLLVSLLYTAYEYKHTIPLKKHVFYRQVYDALFEAHDLSKGDYFQREKHCKLSIDDFHTVLRYVSFICLKLDKIEFTKDEILDVINQANIQCEIIDFENSELLKDLITTVPLFVLEGIYYKWTHKSIFEYFVTQFVYLDTGKNRSNILKDLLIKNKEGKNNNILDIYSNVDYKSFREDIVKIIVKKFIDFCDKSYHEFNYSENILIERKELTFERDEIIIQFENPNDSKKNIQDIYEELQKSAFEIINKKMTIRHGFGIRVSNNVNNNISNLNYTYLFNKDRDDYTLYFILYILTKRNDSLIKKLNRKDEIELKNYNLKKNTIIKVNDNINSILNKSESNFQDTNELMKYYYHSDSVFNYPECVKFLEKLSDSEHIKKQKNFFSI